MTEKQREGDTRKRLLEAAAVEFSENGFRSARVREICREAEANIAAVNYHFRDKKGLYEAVIQYAFENLPRLGIPIRTDRNSRNPEIRLKTYVKSFLGQLLSTGREELYVRLIARELSDPTSALDKLIQRGMKSQVQELISIVAEILGARTNSKRVRRCTGSILGQCLYFQFARPVILATGLESSLSPKVIDELAEHVTEFSLKALKQLR